MGDCSGRPECASVADRESWWLRAASLPRAAFGQAAFGSVQPLEFALGLECFARSGT